jgi:hypothetical protein
VTDEAFRMFCKLATFANKEKRAWPSEETLATEMNLSVRSIRNRIANLVKSGWITQIRRKQASAVYVLESLPDRKNTAGLAEDRQEIAHHENEVRQEVTCLENEDRQNLSIDEPNKTGNILPPNDSNTTIANQALNDSQIEDSGAQPAAPIVTDPPTPSQPETAPKKKRARAAKPKTDKPKPPRTPDIVFDTIAERAFCAPPGDPAVEEVAGRVGKIRAALKRIGCTLLEFTAACDAYERQGLTPGRTPETAVTMVQEYRQEHGANRTNGHGQPKQILSADGVKTPEESRAAMESTRRKLECLTSPA